MSDISLEQIVAILTIIGLSIPFIKKFFGFIYRKWKEIELIHTKIETIFKELTPNGGTSIKDKISKISAQQDVNYQNLMSVKESIIEIRKTAIAADHKTKIFLKKFPSPMFECEIPSGQCIWSNESLQDLFGLEEAEVLGDGWLKSLHPDDIKPTYENWMATAKHWIPYKARYRIQKNDKIIHVEALADIIKDVNGEPISAFGLITVLREE